MYNHVFHALAKQVIYNTCSSRVAGVYQGETLVSSSEHILFWWPGSRTVLARTI